MEVRADYAGTAAAGKQLGPDIVAGVTLAALGIPEVMGYTKIIGTPIITGLHTLFLPAVGFACWAPLATWLSAQIRRQQLWSLPSCSSLVRRKFAAVCPAH